MSSPIVMTARHFAKRGAELAVLDETLAQPVEAFGDELAVGDRPAASRPCRP